MFLSGVGVHDTLEFEEEEDNGGFVNPVGGGGWATDEFIAVCAGMLEGSFASKYERQIMLTFIKFQKKDNNCALDTFTVI